ncbi:aminotransferase class I/II-fold pyridoxal phosphate-dependent enzyme [Marinobacterium sp. CAU 1594]|nr:aminotransferase class I/II-fold pyridoxal phosphate-dependent enzyme [Marinobacterium arenosum]
MNLQGMEPSATVSINERSNQLRAEGVQIYKLGLGQSPFPVPPSLAQALRDNASQKDYLPSQGLPSLRRAIADYYHRELSLSYQPESILVGPGSKELMFILQLALDGELLLPSPSWVSYAPQAKIIGRPVNWLPTRYEDGLKLTAQTLEQNCENGGERPRLLVLNSPNNPTGVCYHPNELKALADVARRHRLLVLSDEIYGAVSFSGEQDSIARYYPEGTIISNGVSKWCGAGGWRLGAMLFPPQLQPLLQAMITIASETFTSTSAPVQFASVWAFEDSSELTSYQRDCRAILSGLGRHCWQRLQAAGAELPEPSGGFYLFPSFEPLRAQLEARGVSNGRQLADRLLGDTGVAVLPGECFGRPAEELSLRLAFVDFDGTRALAGLTNASRPEEHWLRRYCAPVVTAIDLMVDWLGS